MALILLNFWVVYDRWIRLMRLWCIEVFFLEFIGLIHDFRELLFEFSKIGAHLVEFDGWVGFGILSVELIVDMPIWDIGVISWWFEIRCDIVRILTAGKIVIIDWCIGARGKISIVGVVSIGEIRWEMRIWGGHSWAVYLKLKVFYIFYLALKLIRKTKTPIKYSQLFTTFYFLILNIKVFYLIYLNIKVFNIIFFNIITLYLIILFIINFHFLILYFITFYLIIVDQY